MTQPHRIALAQTPTPLMRLRHLSARFQADIWVKRDDLTGFGLSGNKVRKLEYLLGDAVQRGSARVVTCGGVGSNHCRATALGARRVGLEPVLLLRGTAPPVADGNLLLDRLAGAEVHFCSDEAYRSSRSEQMAELAGAKGYVIPEGGSNALGSQGYIRAARELAAQDAHGFDSVVCAVGSGGTVAGLAMGLNGGRLVGMAVCDDAAFFEDRVGAIASEAGKAPQVEWRIDDRYRGSAYAVASQEVWGTIRLVAQLEGLLLDPVYTGKAMHGLLAELKAGRMSGRILFWHTGGAFGLFGRGAEAV